MSSPEQASKPEPVTKVKPARRHAYHGGRGRTDRLPQHLAEVVGMDRPSKAAVRGEEADTRRERWANRSELNETAKSNSWDVLDYEQVEQQRHDIDELTAVRLESPRGLASTDEQLTEEDMRVLAEATRQELAQQIVDKQFPMPAQAQQEKIPVWKIGKRIAREARKWRPSNIPRNIRIERLKKVRANAMRQLTMSDEQFARQADAWKTYEQLGFARAEAKANPGREIKAYDARLAAMEEKYGDVLKLTYEMSVDNDEILRAIQDYDDALEDFMANDGPNGFKAQAKRIKEESARPRQVRKGSAVGETVALTDEQAGDYAKSAFAKAYVSRHFRTGLRNHHSRTTVSAPEQQKAIDRDLNALWRMMRNPDARADFEHYIQAVERKAVYESRREVGHLALAAAASGEFEGATFITPETTGRPEGKDNLTPAEILKNGWARLQWAKEAGRGQGWVTRRLLQLAAVGYTLKEGYWDQKDWKGAYGRTKERTATSREFASRQLDRRVTPWLLGIAGRLASSLSGRAANAGANLDARRQRRAQAQAPEQSS